MGDVIARAMSAVRLELQRYKDAAELARLERDEALDTLGALERGTGHAVDAFRSFGERGVVHLGGRADELGDIVLAEQSETEPVPVPLTVEQVREALRSGAEVETLSPYGPAVVLRGVEGGYEYKLPGDPKWYRSSRPECVLEDAIAGLCIRIIPVGPVTKERAILHMELGGEVSFHYGETVCYRRIVDGQLQVSFDSKKCWVYSCWKPGAAGGAPDFYTLIPFTSVGF